MIVAPVAVATVLAGELIAARRPGSLRRQFGAIAVLGAVSLAIAVALFVERMYFSSHDAVMTVLLVAFATAIVLWLAHRLGRARAGRPRPDRRHAGGGRRRPPRCADTSSAATTKWRAWAATSTR